MHLDHFSESYYLIMNLMKSVLSLGSLCRHQIILKSEEMAKLVVLRAELRVATDSSSLGINIYSL